MPRFVPRERKHKVLARSKKRQLDEKSRHLEDDTNAVEILPQQQQKRRGDHSGQEQLGANGKVSGKKKKRLDKYIVRVVIFSDVYSPKFHESCRLQN